MKTVRVRLIIETTLVKSSFLVELQWYANQNKIAVGFLKITFYSFEKVTSLLDEKACVFFCHCFKIIEIFFVQHF